MSHPLRTIRPGRWLVLAAGLLLSTLAAHAQLTGTKAIPGTSPTGYASVAAAITDLNAQGVGSGGVTFNITPGYTETATNLLITATGTAGNPIVFRKSGSGNNPKITAGTGTGSLDAIIRLSGSDYVTFDGLELAENATNAAAGATNNNRMEFGFALFRPSATDGCQNNTISNCVITLTKLNSNSIGIYGANSTATLATGVAATSTAGANSGNKVNGCIISNAATGVYFLASSPTDNANLDQGNEVGTTAGNQVYNFGGTASNFGIGGNYQAAFKVAGNTLNTSLNYAGGTTTAVDATTVTSTLRGIYTPNGPSANVDITNNVITLASGGTTTALTGIDNGIGATANSNTITITGNTVQLSYATATTATITGITSSAGATTVNVSNNTVQNCTAPAATTAPFTAITSSVSNLATGRSLTMSANTITGNVIAGTGTMTLLAATAGSAGTPLTMSNNSITNNRKTPAGTTAAVTLTCLSVGVSVNTLSGNTVTNNSIVTSGTSSSAGTLYGIFSTGTGNSTSYEPYSTNVVTGLSISGTSTATTHVIAGIRPSASTADVLAMTSNTVGNLAISSGSGTVTGVLLAGGGAAGTSLNRNKIYDLSATGAAASVSGIGIAAGGTYGVVNNLIGDLRTPAATSLTAVSGLNVSGGTAVNPSFNTIYLNATSSGATFGTSGIYAATGTTLTLRDNIVINKSTAVGANGYTVALRRTSGTPGTPPTTGSLDAATNNNVYFAGTPSATNLIYLEGSATPTNPQQQLTDYQAFVASRESNSITEDVPFASTTGTDATYLHISSTTPTRVESGGIPVSGITMDYDNDPRNATTPDIGADEGNFVLLDVTAPTITLSPLSNTASTADRTLPVTITDMSGISTSTPPRLFYRKGASGAYLSATATSVSGSTYTFTLSSAALGGVVAGDVVQYYVVAQDASANSNVASSPAGGTYASAPATPYQYTIGPGMNGTYYVGTSASPDPARTYATLTAAANAYANNGLTGPVTLLLLDNAYSAATGETFPITFLNSTDASATNTLLVKPNAGATPVISSAGNVLALMGSRYVTIDGANTTGGTTRDLTLATTSTAAGSYNVGLLAPSGSIPANLFATVRNVSVTGGGATTNATAGIQLSGADNDNVTLQNNSIQGVSVGIQAVGTANASAGGLDNLLITGNTVGPPTAAIGANINQTGIQVTSAIGPQVSQNEVQNVVNPTSSNVTQTGIALQDVKGGLISRNSVHDLTYNGTSTAKVYGISTATTAFNAAGNPSASRFDNNLVYALTSSATSGVWNTSGLNNNGGYGDQYYYNTVYLSGMLSGATGTAGSAAFSNGNGLTAAAATNIDVRDNIFSILNGSGGSATTPLYAHYTTLTTYAGSTLNNNDLYVTAGATGLAVIGRLNATDQPDLAAWRIATGQEAASVSANPQFTQTATSPYDLRPTNAALDNTGTPVAVTSDYSGTARSSSTPDIGAYEFTAAPLPVQLTAFTAQPDGPAAVALAWRTASELNSARFEVERSPDGVSFARIGSVVARGTSATASTYHYRDAQLPAARLYYRLRQVDLDGTAHYSPVQAVTLGAAAGLTLFPNPTQHATTLTGAAPGTPVCLFDALGRPLLNTLASEAGTATLALPAGLPVGVYLVRVGNQALRLAVQ